MENDEMIDFMEKNKELVRQSNLYELAEILNISESALSRRIKRYYGCSFLELKERFRQNIMNEKTNYIIVELLNFYDQYEKLLRIFEERIKLTNKVAIIANNLTDIPTEYLMLVMREKEILINFEESENSIVQFNFCKINQHKITIALNDVKIIIESRYKLMLYFSYAITYLVRK